MNETAVTLADPHALQANVVSILLAVGPILLAARFIWPSRFTWSIVASLAAACTFVLVLYQHFFVWGDFVFPFYFRWCVDLAFGLPWLIPYGILQWLRNRYAIPVDGGA